MKINNLTQFLILENVFLEYFLGWRWIECLEKIKNLDRFLAIELCYAWYYFACVNVYIITVIKVITIRIVKQSVIQSIAYSS